MNRFKNIIALHHNEIGDEATLRRATALARRNRARLKVVEVIDQALRPTPELVEQRLFNLERVATSIREEGVDVGARVLTGNAVLAITREVLRANHDLLLISAEGQLGLKSRLFGNTALHLMRKCPCPVWVIKRQGASPPRYTRIMAAVDLKSSDQGGKPLDRTILELATSLADREGSDLHIVHAWELAGGERDRSQSELTPAMRAQLIEKNEARRRVQIEGLLTHCELGDLDYHVHALRGEPVSVLLDIANQLGIELIVMGTSSRTGVHGFLIGNTAEAILQQVDSAVLTVKPEGFVTPVLDESGVPVEPGRAGLERASRTQ